KKAAGKKASDEAIVEVAVAEKALPTKKVKVEQPAESTATASIGAIEPTQQQVAINLEDELMSLPLAERINRMLAYKPVSLQPVPVAGSALAGAPSESTSASIFGRPAAAQKMTAAKKKASAATGPRKKAGIAARPAAQKRPSDSDAIDDKDASRTAGKD